MKHLKKNKFLCPPVAASLLVSNILLITQFSNKIYVFPLGARDYVSNPYSELKIRKHSQKLT
jgi:hypothetical protein